MMEDAVEACSHGYLQLVLVGTGCLIAGYYLCRRWPALLPPRMKKQAEKRSAVHQYDGKKDLHPVEVLADKHEDFKMVLVVRNDLKMGKGKIAAQCSHSSLGLYKKLFFRAPKALQRWEMCGSVKVVTKTESEEELLFLQSRAKSLKLPTHITIDAGRTQIAANSRTVLTVLGPDELVDEVTGSLKLL
ncbi:peptidyl-tRNA hydrolase 2, mitochondrial [Selaginella moellendorffii]|nr:peptidyl-tRNA hydrolase 2, mitochondrial [Selaginella moellendorffii]|eukprot:XP_002963634.2 peptidyl-tRNA hydrolase 2, mitochondrial [Selaginella moellendorffii]